MLAANSKWMSIRIFLHARLAQVSVRTGSTNKSSALDWMRAAKVASYCMSWYSVGGPLRDLLLKGIPGFLIEVHVKEAMAQHIEPEVHCLLARSKQFG